MADLTPYQTVGPFLHIGLCEGRGPMSAPTLTTPIVIGGRLLDGAGAGIGDGVVEFWAKGFDTSCPLGPWIETELDPGDLRITTTLDDVVKQDGTTADMVHGVASIIEYASAAFTLLPGDVILTGTPAGVGLVEPGQRVTVDIDGIGSLTNTFVRR